MVAMLDVWPTGLVVGTGRDCGAPGGHQLGALDVTDQWGAGEGTCDSGSP